MASKAKPLNEELKKVFFPLVESKGFVRSRSTDPHFVIFKRSTDRGEDVFEIQWDKYWRPYFVVNFEKCGVNESPWNENGRLQRRRGGSLSCWFSLFPPLLERFLNFRWKYTPNEVVRELIEKFPELEEWWLSGTVGHHMYIVGRHA
ncbi:hypothetical protein ACONUD_10085 [Microbulbifer harenosus]|uniref:DUF4304 domain-containing protein n=1 Tax=Microbulbifer harenosus TaxID=2576840 RepID=A0ABY2UCW3_9GAMM|nr:hypothetical protein [Microbulbifer harenosus]TLM73389.1 hypothetical protein FDY93_19050 [Microbulbifer harenosus]